MDDLKTTNQVVRLLGVPHGRISALIRAGRIKAPARQKGFAYLWTEEEVDRLRQEARIDRRSREYRRARPARTCRAAAS